MNNARHAKTRMSRLGAFIGKIARRHKSVRAWQGGSSANRVRTGSQKRMTDRAVGPKDRVAHMNRQVIRAKEERTVGDIGR